MNVPRGLRLTAAALAVGTAMAIAPMKPASAASPCEVYGSQWLCDVVGGSPVYSLPGSYQIGNIPWGWQQTLFTCKTDNGPWNGEGWPHPYRWVWVDEGDVHGWVNDRNIYDETNPIPQCYGW